MPAHPVCSSQAHLRHLPVTYHPNTTDSQGNTVLGRIASIDGAQTGGQDTQTFEYNGQGLLSTINLPLNQAIQLTYNTIGQLATLTDSNNVVTSFQYNSDNQTISRTQDGRTQQFTYNAQGRITSATDELGRLTQLGYNEYNQVQKVTYPSGDYLLLSYVYASRYTEITQTYYQANDSLISTRVVRLNPESQLPEQSYLASTAQQIDDKQYNGLNELTQTTRYGQYGSQTSASTQYGYNSEGKLISIIDALNGETTFEYDVFNRVEKVIDANNAATDYLYTAWNEISQQTSPDTGLSDYVYDPAGNRIQQINANNQQTNYSYDALNRLSVMDYAGSDLDSTLSYDQGDNGKGHLTAVTDGSGSSDYQYNDQGLMSYVETNIAGTVQTTAYTYNDANELTRITYPSGLQINTAYDLSGRFSGIQMNDNNTNTELLSNITWYGPEINSYQQGNGLSTTMSYDTAGRLIEKHYDDNNSLQNQLDNQSQITQQILTRNGIADTNNYQYDRLGRMSQDGSPVDNEDWQFSYDSVGNRLTKNKADNSDNTSYSYETNSNRQTQINTTTILRDAAGNTFDDGRRVYQYNAMNRMAQVTDSQTNTTARYTYNFQGQRVRKQLYGGISVDIRYVYGQQGELLGEYDASGKRLKEYVYHYQNNLAELIAQIEADGSVLYIHTDHLATPRLATDQNKSIVWRWVSDGFGEGMANEDADGNGDLTIVNHRFPGQYYDQESGLSYNYFRDYDPATGRYVQSDPIGLAGGLNTYAYVRNNPLKYIDPFGLDSLVADFSIGTVTH